MFGTQTLPVNDTLTKRFSHRHRESPKAPWALILAGGDGVRLRPLTRGEDGEDRPKQFAQIFGTETLLQQTARRIHNVVDPARTLVIATKAHERFLGEDVAREDTSVILQPGNRGTAPAILYGLMSVPRKDARAPVVLVPTDHYFENETIFLDAVASAFRVIAECPDLVILLGISPTGPESDYGWIRPGSPVNGVSDNWICYVRQFWEKPGPSLARHLFETGCLWNSLVLISSVQALLELISWTSPELFEQFEEARPNLSTAVTEIYKNLRDLDFSREVLCACPEALTVLPVIGSGWVDLGSPDRVQSVLRIRS